MKRRGVALVLVLIAVTITAALAAGILITTSTQTRSSGDAHRVLRVSEAAERGVIGIASAWNPESSLTMTAGQTIGPQVLTYPDSSRSTSFVTKLSRTTFWIVAQGSLSSTGAPAPVTRRIGVLYALDLPEPHLTATVNVADSLLISGTARIDGSDTAPVGWTSLCTGPVSPVAGAAAPDTSHVCDGSCGSVPTRIAGNPAKLLDSLAGSSAVLTQLGPVTWTALAAHARRVVPTGTVLTPMPVLTGAQCDTTVSSNWGDPTRTTACRNHFVIVHALGDLIMNGGLGQGILMADGDVELRNGAQFFGLILARDDFSAVVGPNSVWGSVIAGDTRRAIGDYSVIAGGTAVTYSSCAVEMSLIGTAPLRRTALRAWHQLY